MTETRLSKFKLLDIFKKALEQNPDIAYAWFKETFPFLQVSKIEKRYNTGTSALQTAKLKRDQKSCKHSPALADLLSSFLEEFIKELPEESLQELLE